MVENVADLMANVADLMANVADLMANVAIEKPLSYALSIGYLQETSSLLCRIHRFPREKTVVSTRETDGFRRGNRWIPVWKPMETCVETNGDLRGNRWRPASITMRKPRFRSMQVPMAIAREAR